VAFFVTAAATVGAIIFGYLTESFPESYFNDLDRFAMAAFKKSKIFKVMSWLSGVLYSLKGRLKSFLGLKVDANPPSLSPEARQEALSRFILALSDQQLVTGLAILIGGVANQWILSIYEFAVLLSLAWFSSTTHLATLGALRDYFVKHGVVRNWRVGGMLSLLVLLTYCLFITTLAIYTSLDRTVPLQCYFSPQQNPGAAPGALNTVAAMQLAATIMTLYILLGSYVVRVHALYNRSCKTETAINVTGRLAWRMAKFYQFKHSQTRPEFLKVTAEVHASIRLEDLNKIRKASTRSKWAARWYISSYQYDDSFLSAMSGIAFSFSYGITQVVSYRWLYGQGLAGTASAVDFGQITPLFLLVLPILAAAEIYYGISPVLERRRQYAND
jgi:hypothetical protein